MSIADLLKRVSRSSTFPLRTRYTTFLKSWRSSKSGLCFTVISSSFRSLTKRPLSPIICRDERFPICCHQQKGQTTVLTDTQVTATLREAVVRAYPNPNHVFRQQLNLFRTHSIRVFACCTLVAAGLSTEQIEYKLRWCSTSWKGYIRESLSEVDLISLKIFSSGLTDANPQEGGTPFLTNTT